MSKVWTPKSDAEVMADLKAPVSALNRARRPFSSHCAKIEQAGAQRKPLDPIALRRMEFDAVAEIAAALASGPGWLELPIGYEVEQSERGYWWYITPERFDTVYKDGLPQLSVRAPNAFSLADDGTSLDTRAAAVAAAWAHFRTHG